VSLFERDNRENKMGIIQYEDLEDLTLYVHRVAETTKVSVLVQDPKNENKYLWKRASIGAKGTVTSPNRESGDKGEK
jgi:hypothetical protein